MDFPEILKRIKKWNKTQGNHPTIYDCLQPSGNPPRFQLQASSAATSEDHSLILVDSLAGIPGLGGLEGSLKFCLTNSFCKSSYV